MKEELKQYIDEVVDEVSYRISPDNLDWSNPNHLATLSEVMVETGLPYNIREAWIRSVKELYYPVNEADSERDKEKAKERSREAEDKKFKLPVLNKVIQWVDEDGEEKEGLVGDLLRLGDDKPGRKEAEKHVPEEGTENRQEINNELGSENQPGRDDIPEPDADTPDEEGEGEGEDDDVPSGQGVFDADTKGGAEALAALPPDDPAHQPLQVYSVEGEYYSSEENGRPQYQKAEDGAAELYGIKGDEKESIPLMKLSKDDLEQIHAKKDDSDTEDNEKNTE